MTYTIETFRKAVNGDEKSIERTIVQFTPLVHKLVNMYLHMVPKHMEKDLVQEGKIGIVNGIRTFDLSRKVVPMTWMFWKVREAIQGAARKEKKHPKYTESIDEVDVGYDGEVNPKIDVPQIKEILLDRYGGPDTQGFKIICSKYGLFNHTKLTQSEIAKEFGVTKQAVSSCVARFTTSFRKKHPELIDLFR
jgi:RNA polymerase sigma factor (sigma-70 family)